MRNSSIQKTSKTSKQNTSEEGISGGSSTTWIWPIGPFKQPDMAVIPEHVRYDILLLYLAKTAAHDDVSLAYLRNIKTSKNPNRSFTFVQTRKRDTSNHLTLTDVPGISEEICLVPFPRSSWAINNELSGEPRYHRENGKGFLYQERDIQDYPANLVLILGPAVCGRIRLDHERKPHEKFVTITSAVPEEESPWSKAYRALQPVWPRTISQKGRHTEPGESLAKRSHVHASAQGATMELPYPNVHFDRQTTTTPPSVTEQGGDTPSKMDGSRHYTRGTPDRIQDRNTFPLAIGRFSTFISFLADFWLITLTLGFSAVRSTAAEKVEFTQSPRCVVFWMERNHILFQDSVGTSVLDSNLSYVGGFNGSTFVKLSQQPKFASDHSLKADGDVPKLAGCPSDGHLQDFKRSVVVQVEGKTTTCFGEANNTWCIDAYQSRNTCIRLHTRMSPDFVFSEHESVIKWQCPETNTSAAEYAATITYDDHGVALSYASFANATTGIFCNRSFTYSELESLAGGVLGQNLHGEDENVYSTHQATPIRVSMNETARRITVLTTSHRYTITNDMIEKVELNYCQSASTCDSCGTMDCGWCIWENRCTTESICESLRRKTRNVQGQDLWIPTYLNPEYQAQCPSVLYPPEHKERVMLTDENKQHWRMEVGPVQFHIDNWTPTRNLPSLLTCVFGASDGNTWQTLSRPDYVSASRTDVRIKCPCPEEPSWNAYLINATQAVVMGKSSHNFTIAVGLDTTRPLFKHPFTVAPRGDDKPLSARSLQPSSARGSVESVILFNTPTNIPASSRGSLSVTFHGQNVHRMMQLQINVGKYSCELREKTESQVKCLLKVPSDAQRGTMQVEIVLNGSRIVCRKCSVAYIDVTDTDHEVMVGVVAAMFGIIFCLCLATVGVWRKFVHTSKKNSESIEKLGLLVDDPSCKTVKSLRSALAIRQQQEDIGTP